MFLKRTLVLTGVLAATGLLLAPAASAQTITIQTATTAMTSTAHFSTALATASCPTGTTLVGGGDQLTNASGANVANDGAVTEGTMPSDASGNALTAGATNPAWWTATGGYSGQAPGTDSVTSFAMCSTAVTSATVIEVTAVAGLGPATAVCPTGTTLVGGGGFTMFNNSNNTKLVDSYPSDNAGDVPADGLVNPTAWTAGSNSNNATGATTTANAVCATDVAVPTMVSAVTTTLSTVAGGAPLPATASCASGTELLDGGSWINTEGGPGTGGQGIHLIGDYPSDGSGTAATSGSASSWTAAADNGGQNLAAMATTAFALCDTSTPTTSVPEATYPALMVTAGILAGGFVLYRRRGAVAVL